MKLLFIQFLTITVLSFGPIWNKHAELFAAEKHPPMTVEQAWVRAVPPVSKNSAAYMLLHNHSDDEDILLSAQSDLASVTELHEVVKKGDLMSMQPAGRVVVPSHGILPLKPGGIHIMLINLKSPLKTGDQTTLRLKFKNAGEVTVTAQILEGMPDSEHHHDSKAHDASHTTHHHSAEEHNKIHSEHAEGKAMHKHSDSN
ncbi:MAG: copper chaperone PCu(A)C [SAR324 cluster bacterium]|nr:copper chaperone PCu(A)C [SAR324 cluster bacterium]